MGKKYESCIRKMKAKIKSGEIEKTFKCDSKGNANSKGRKRCRSDPYALCEKSR